MVDKKLKTTIQFSEKIIFGLHVVLFLIFKRVLPWALIAPIDVHVNVRNGFYQQPMLNPIHSELLLTSIAKMN